MDRRILYVIDSLQIGGAETLMLDLLDAAIARKWLPHVAYFTPGALAGEVASRGVATTRLSRAGLGDPLAVARAFGLMRRLRPDVVHTHLTKSDLVGQFAGALAGAPRRVLSLHNVDPWRRRRWLSWIWRAVTVGAHVRVAVSERVADHVAMCGGASRDALTVIDNGVDTRRFDRDATRPLDRAAWGFGPDDVIVAVVGRLTPQKDHATFLAAAATLAPRTPRARFLVVGEGELRASLEAQAQALGLGPDRLRFGGALRDMPGLLAAVDVVAFSSAWEGLPMALLEAMAMRLPVVATMVGGVPGVVRDDVEGLLVAPRAPAALAEAMERLVGDAALRRRLGAAGRSCVETRFSASAMLGRLFHLYEETGR
jgi:glycosyltransferase involved in cell wall biosynthesis